MVLDTVIQLIRRHELDQYAPPGDSVLAVALVFLLDWLVLTAPPGLGPLQPILGLAVLLVVPGFVLVVAAFPRRHDGNDWMEARPGPVTSRPDLRRVSGRRIDWRTRLALSFGTSVALLPLLGVLVVPITGSLSPQWVLASVTGFVLVGVAVGIVRRSALPEHERFRLPYRRLRSGASEFLGGNYRSTAVSVAFVLSLLVAVGTLSVVLVAPLSGESYTSATLLTEGPDGDLVTSGYPTEFGGEGEQLLWRVENNEGGRTTYSVVAELQRLEGPPDSTTVTETERLLSRQTVLDAGETWTHRHEISPSMTGQDLRLTYYVYRGDPPADPDAASAYRELYLWISVPE